MYYNIILINVEYYSFEPRKLQFGSHKNYSFVPIKIIVFCPTKITVLPQNFIKDILVLYFRNDSLVLNFKMTV